MKMTIDEAIEIISDIDKAYRTFSSAEYEAMQKSIDTMHKYQRIEQIVTKWYNDKSVNTAMAMLEIKEVVEDGKID